MQVLLTLGVKIDILTIFFATLHGVRAYSQALLPSLVALRLEEGQISTWLPAKRSRGLEQAIGFLGQADSQPLH